MILGTRRRGLWLAALALLAVGMTGCNDKVKAERDRLYAENTELRQRLDAADADLQSAQADRDAMMARIAALEKPATTTGAGVAMSNTGFEQIGGVSVERGSHGEVTVRVPGDVLFSSGSATVKTSAKRTLDDVASVLKRQYSGRMVRVEGYTDSDPIRKSKWKDNMELSLARAGAVVRYLTTRGVDQERLAATGYGASNFRAPNTTAAGKAQNRRVEIVVIMN
jgi:flagellar motor protein MotB